VTRASRRWSPYYKDFEAKTTYQIAVLFPGRHFPMSGGDHTLFRPDVKCSIDSSDQYLSACQGVTPETLTYELGKRPTRFFATAILYKNFWHFFVHFLSGGFRELPDIARKKFRVDEGSISKII
jgi:hypothetical protein